MNVCLECGKETKNKKFCNLSCFAKHQAEQNRLNSIKEYYKNPKYCKECGEIIHVEHYAHEAKKKVFCSQSCAATFNNRKYPKRGDSKPKYCKNCGKELLGDKRQNTYCDLVCFNEYRNKDYIKKWLAGKKSGTTKSGKYLSEIVRNYLLEKSNYSCELCGWSEINPITGKVPVQIDHKDGNASNNRPDNLRVLCPNCHSLTETFGALNKGNGRDWRY